MPQRMEGVIERIRENKLDALYLFINETLRDRTQFEIFFHNLMNVLPNNWSINRVEIGHEFLSMITAEGGIAAEGGGGILEALAAAQAAQGDETIEIEENKQDSLFYWVCSLESLRSLIISDGYIPRQDHGFCDTKSLLRNLPLAKNLQYLDIQRLKLNTNDNTETLGETAAAAGSGSAGARDGTSSLTLVEDAELLANSLESITDSLEDIRLTSITICDKSNNNAMATTTTTAATQRYPLDAAIRVCGDMANLQLLAISCASGTTKNNNENENDDGNNEENENENNDDDDAILQDGEQQQQQQQQDDGNGSSSSSEDNATTSKMIHENSCLISNEVLLELCRTSTTLQELALRSMRIDDNMCKTIAEAFDPPNSNHHHRIMAMPTSFHRVGSSNNLHTTEEEDYNDDASIQTNTHSPSFWTSLDLRQNPNIGTIGYNAILASLERNYDLWCSLMVDNESFQSKFNALIELNQANRGTLIRSPSVDKLAIFIDRLNSNNSSSSSSGGGGDSGDPTSLWYFLNIHRNSILHPYVRYMKWKNMILRRRKKEKEDAALSVASAAAVITTSRQQQPQPQQREYNLPPHPQRAAASTTTTIDGSNTGYGSSTSACSPSSDQQSGLTISAVEQHNTTRRTNNAEEEEKEEDRQHQHQQQQPDLKRYKQSSD